MWMLPPKDCLDRPSLTLGGDLLPSERARNLCVLLDSQLKLDHHLAAVTRGTFAQVRLVHQGDICPGLPGAPVATLFGSGGSSDGRSCPCRLWAGLLRCALHGATLEKYSETTAGPECSRASDIGGSSILSRYTYPSRAALAAYWSLDPILGVGYHL
uniref:Uncharacterized protein n=1 Tax=Micrurus spixii TaxID=129469 RepID=A0A2D4LTH9_9SAUR